VEYPGTFSGEINSFIQSCPCRRKHNHGFGLCALTTIRWALRSNYHPKTQCSGMYAYMNVSSENHSMGFLFFLLNFVDENAMAVTSYNARNSPTHMHIPGAC
jgi:hypothetical protein